MFPLKWNGVNVGYLECVYYKILFFSFASSSSSNHPKLTFILHHYDSPWFYIFKSFWRTHMSFFGATGTPVLDFWWHLLWVSKPEWVLPYSHCGGECNVHSLRSTSGATHADLLAASLPPVLSPHTSAEVRLPGFKFHGFIFTFLEW